MKEDESRRGPEPLYGERMIRYITVPLPDFINEQLIRTAKKLNRKKTDLARNAIEDFLSYLDQN